MLQYFYYHFSSREVSSFISTNLNFIESILYERVILKDRTLMSKYFSAFSILFSLDWGTDVSFDNYEFLYPKKRYINNVNVCHNLMKVCFRITDFVFLLMYYENLF